MCELKANKKKGSKLAEVKTAYIVEVGSFNASNPYLLPLSNSFNFNFFFSILPNVISDNIPILFL